MIRLKDYTLTSMLEAAAARFGRLTALNTWRADDALSYTQLLQLSMNVAFYFHRVGIGKNDKVAILGESCPNWGLSYLAVNRSGAVAVPVLPDFSAHEVRSILEHSGARIVVVNARNASKLEGCDVRVIRMEDMTEVPVFACTDAQAFRKASGTDTRVVIPSDADKAELGMLRPSEDDVASIIYTSGTTGTPKAVMLTNRNIVFNAYECSTPFIRIHACWHALSILPMSHVYEFTIGFVLLLINGVHITYLGKAPSTDTLLPAMKEVRPQIMLSVPLLIEKIYRRALLPKLKEGTRLGNLSRNRFTAPLVYRVIGNRVRKLFGGRIRFFGVGGAAFDSEAEAFFHKISFPYALGYGLTETAPFIAGCGPRDQVPGTLGPVLKSLDVRLDPDTGEVLVKGPSVMKGYYRNSELTSEVFTQDGYFRTGDIGEFAEGRLRIKGRCKTMILGPSGENIYPENIEFLINSEEDVIESLVVADKGGLTAMIRLDMKALKKKGIVAIEAIQSKLDAIISGVNGKLSAFSRVRKAEIRELPFERTPTDKIKRFLYQKKA